MIRELNELSTLVANVQLPDDRYGLYIVAGLALGTVVVGCYGLYRLHRGLHALGRGEYNPVKKDDSNLILDNVAKGAVE